MKQLVLASVLVFGLILPGCGGSSSGNLSGHINGAWRATLTNPDGTTNVTFTATFAQGSGSNLNVTNFTFTTPDPCLGTQSVSETGTFTNMTGKFTMTISSPGPEPETLALQGTLTNGDIIGNWSRGTCPGSGTLRISPIPIV